MNTNIKIDVVIDLAHGDSGKGKVSHALLAKRDYTHCLRFNGGGNAGHTIYHEGKKFVTHLIPSGVFHGIRSVIGPGCVARTSKLLEEVKYLEDNLGKKINIGIANNVHLVTEEHLTEDSGDTRIGTTKTGNGPAYSAKYSRKGVRASTDPLLQNYLTDMYEEFYNQEDKACPPTIRILAEGAQSFNLDIDWGDYPYVTSSHCGIGGLLNNGFNHKHVRNVYGVVKAYDTYVGAKQFQPVGDVFNRIQEVGQEFGATTGRRRQVNWLNWNIIERGIRMNGVNTLIVNKGDVLDQIGSWGIIENGETIEFSTKNLFKQWLDNKTYELDMNNIVFSEGADDLSFVDRL
jgi:adenylosuccinate synthase